MLALLLLLFAGYADQLGVMPDARLLADLRSEVTGKLAPLLADTFTGGATALGAEADQAAVKWAKAYADELAAAITDNTRERLLAARQAEQQGYHDEAEEIRRGAFAPVRAEAISITETTRADTMGQRYGAHRLGQQGQPMTAFWVAEQDGKVCPICQKMDGQPEDLWEYLEPELGAGPPGHPRCRCRIRWEAVGKPQELQTA